LFECHLLGVFFKRVQNGGPALATALATFFDFFALLIIFRLRYGPMGTMEIFRSFFKVSVCAGIMGVACWFGNYYTVFTIHSRFLVQLLVFSGLILGATALYLGLAWLFRCHEIEEVYGLPPGARLAPVPVTDTRGADGDFGNHIVVFDSRAR